MHQLLTPAPPTKGSGTRRCVGIVLAEIGRQRLAGRKDIADLLDRLVTEMEQSTRPRAEFAGNPAGE